MKNKVKAVGKGIFYYGSLCGICVLTCIGAGVSVKKLTNNSIIAYFAGGAVEWLTLDYMWNTERNINKRKEIKELWNTK